MSSQYLESRYVGHLVTLHFLKNTLHTLLVHDRALVFCRMHYLLYVLV